MLLTLKFDSPPFSCNNSHYRNGNRTKKCRAWGDHILDQLEPFSDSIDSFREQFDRLKHSLETELIFMYPREYLFTAGGYISRRSMDCSNIEKLLVDLIFDKRFFERGTNNLNLDDTLVTKQVSRKVLSPSNEYLILVNIKIIPLDKNPFKI